MTDVRFIYEPLTNPEAIPDTPLVDSRFDTPWSKLLEDLDREVWHLGARQAVIEVDVDRSRIRQDGGMRADAKVRSGRVRVSFTSEHGPLSFASGRYARRTNTGPDWQHNLRAIVLTMKALRDVDRYGVVQGGEQYRGFLALTAGPTDPFQNADEAARWVRGLFPGIDGAYDNTTLRAVVRRARAEMHPDRTGDREQWDRLERAIDLITAGGLL